MEKMQIEAKAKAAANQPSSSKQDEPLMTPPPRSAVPPEVPASPALDADDPARRKVAEKRANLERTGSVFTLPPGDAAGEIRLGAGSLAKRERSDSRARTKMPTGTTSKSAGAAPAP
eukprot:201347-Karenia_brevis.AAC.1